MIMRHLNILGVTLVLIATCGCSSKQWVGKRSDLYSVTPGPMGSVSDRITKHKSSGCARASVALRENRVDVRVDSSSTHKITQVGLAQESDRRARDFRTADNSYIYPENRWTGMSEEHFRYTEAQWFLQPMTIALRFRGAVDTIPGTAQSGFNVGLAYGYRINSVRWRETKNAFNSNTSRIGAAGSILASLGATELSKSNTTGDAFSVGRSLPTVSLGAMLAISFNGLDMGLAGGWDHAVGGHADDWIYQGRPWWGVVLGVALFK